MTAPVLRSGPECLLSLKKKKFGLRWWLEYTSIVAGAAICGAAIALLLEPNNIIPGGITGMAMILEDLLGVPMGAVLVILNMPLLVFGWRHLGGRRLLSRTVTGVVVMAATIDLVSALAPALTHDRLLVIFYGGLLSGFGLALVLRGRGTTGGADILGACCRSG